MRRQNGRSNVWRQQVGMRSAPRGSRNAPPAMSNSCLRTTAVNDRHVPLVAGAGSDQPGMHTCKNRSDVLDAEATDVVPKLCPHAHPCRLCSACFPCSAFDAPFAMYPSIDLPACSSWMFFCHEFGWAHPPCARRQAPARRRRLARSASCIRSGKLQKNVGFWKP